MNNEKVQSALNSQQELKKKKIYTSGCGTNFNYTWTPSVITKLYIIYVEKFQAATKKVNINNNKMKDPVFLKVITESPEKAEIFNKVAQSGLDDIMEVNELGDDLVRLILNKNPQEFDDLEKVMEEDMSTADKVNLISYACIGDPNEIKDQKKNTNK